MCLCAYVFVHLHMGACDTQGGQKRVSGTLELELQRVGGCVVWLLGTGLR